MTVYGVDFANERPDPAALVKAGKHFVVRYLSPNTRNNPRKEMGAAELKTYRDQQMAVCVVWETTTSRAEEGRTAGQEDAKAAVVQLGLLGFPARQPVYFAVDEDVEGAQVDAYFRGVADIVGVRRTGAYAGVKVIKYLFDHALVRYGWQTYAWSNNRWDGRAQARQTQNGVLVAGQTVDLDEAIDPDYGQWEAEVALSADDIKAIWDAPILNSVTGKYVAARDFLTSINRQVNDLRAVRDELVAGLASVKTTVEQIAAAPAGSNSGLTEAQERALVHDELGHLTISVSPEA